ncbi:MULTISPECIES: efflux transporter SaoE [Jonquetella]|uniref:Putative permease n=1 Tax=Jonquetella anthropi DSM 22815 TaxID=885272 RepID=H0UJX5_9BACT|nr:MULTISPECIES: efflux transporter SaoE [Jonquetella]EEX48747.1 putative permease [Jonquetella anthropi E3_33 E1]EHM12985.1 putative permease [Jonquetella anthropi DSM 22815]ERL23514.1 putative permease [Jonquetella sp. BV3C21]
MKLFFQYCWEMLKTSGPWLIISFLLCGVLHAVLRPEALQRSLGNKKFSSIVKATVSGMLLPICSCGVVPLSLGLYYSGAYLGPTLAFLVATPIINPAAVILAYAMLGPQIATVYLLSGFIIPATIGVIGNALGGPELQSPMAAGLAGNAEQAHDYKLQPLAQRLKGGLEWGFNDLAVQTCRFILVGTAFAALLLAVMPVSFILDYLSNPRLVSLLGITLLGCVMYVCALGHIPFIAALVSAGAAPGVAVTFLLSSVATNFPEMVSIWRLIGKRAVVIYTGTLVVCGLIFGSITNYLFAERFRPIFDLSHSQGQIDFAYKFSFDFSDRFKLFCALLVLGIGCYGWFLHVCRTLRRRA